MQPSTPLDQPRALGHARVSSKISGGRSRIDALRQSGALKLVFPRNQNNVEAVIINTAGGITGGDRFDVDAEAGPVSHLTLTTQAAERVYRAQPGQIGRSKTHLRVKAGATLRWLPQETILFEAAALRRSLTVDLEADARFLMVEPLLFGRRAMGEEPVSLDFQDRVEIRRLGRPVYRDGIRMRGNAAMHLDRPAVAAGARAVASVVLVAPEADGALPGVRAILADAGGASLLQGGVLIARLLGLDGFELRRRLVPLLDFLTHQTLPTSWRL